MRRQAQRAERGVRSSTHAVEAAILIIVVPATESTCPLINPKKRTKEDHRKDHGRSFRCHIECSTSGKSPKKGHGTRGSSSTNLDFLGHDL